MYIRRALIRGLADYRRNLVRNLGGAWGDRTTIPKNEKSFGAVMGLNKVVSSQKNALRSNGRRALGDDDAADGENQDLGVLTISEILSWPNICNFEFCQFPGSVSQDPVARIW